MLVLSSYFFYFIIFDFFIQQYNFYLIFLNIKILIKQNLYNFIIYFVETYFLILIHIIISPFLNFNVKKKIHLLKIFYL